MIVGVLVSTAFVADQLRRATLYAKPPKRLSLLGEQNRGVLMDEGMGYPSEHRWEMPKIDESKICDFLTHADRFKSVHWNSDACVVAPSIVVVKKMNALSTAIRQKERWWDKVHNDTVVLKWAAESKLGAESFDRVIAELWHLADTRVRPEARPAPVDGVFESDGAVPPDALAALRNGADQLAADGPRDVHPGSNGLVIDLVHPSLYPFIEGLSDISNLSDAGGEIVALLPSMHQLTRPRKRRRNPLDVVSKYQWLPTLFRVSNNGTVSAASYINNLNGSRYPEMVSGIERALSACLPLLEEVLTELRRDGAPFNMRSANPAATVDMYALWEEPE